MPQNQQKTKFPGVYTDKNGKFFIQTEFGIDRVTGNVYERNQGQINTEIHLIRLQKHIRN